MYSPSNNLYQQAMCSESPRKSMTPTRATRTVSFSPDVHVKRTLHINNYSDDEITATWFNETDFQRIHQEISVTVQMMERSEPIDHNKYCSRGLEFRTRVGAHQRLQNKVDARDAVLTEQDLQWNEDIDDPEMLADVYRDISRCCIVSAHMAGLFDEKMARDFDARVGQGMYRRSKKSAITCSVSGSRRHAM